MVDVTLLELDLAGADINANAPFSGRRSNPGEDVTESGGSSRGRTLALLAVLAIVAVAVARRRRRGGTTEEPAKTTSRIRDKVAAR